MTTDAVIHRATLYERLADELAAAILGGVLMTGERLPSIRRLAEQKRLSVSTVMQASRLLEDRGLVEARPQAGFYVRPRVRHLAAVPAPTQLPGPAHVAVSNFLVEVLRTHDVPGMVQLGSALPPDDMLPVARLQRSVRNVARGGPALFSNQSYFRQAEPGFVRQILRRALDWGQLDAEEIVATSSCTEAVGLCLRAVTKPGDTVAVESATYFVLLQLLESLGLKALEIPSDAATGVSLPALELAMREGLVQACLLIPNANNPTGSIMPEAHKQRLAELASRFDIAVIEDDIYRQLCFAPRQPLPVKAYDTTGKILLCSSYAKLLGPSMRAGYVAAGKYAPRVAFLKTVTSGATSHLAQAVVADFIGSSGYDAHLRSMRRLMAQRIAAMSDLVAAAFPDQCRLSQPQGGFVLWVALPAQVDVPALHRQAVAQRIAFMPGPLFSASGQLRSHLRLNCAAPADQATAHAIGTLGGLVRQAADGPALLVADGR